MLFLDGVAAVDDLRDTKTATPLFYAYRIFNCQEYYEDPSHPPYEGTGDACAITAIDTGTAKDITVMITLTTVEFLSGPLHISI